MSFWVKVNLNHCKTSCCGKVSSKMHGKPMQPIIKRNTISLKVQLAYYLFIQQHCVIIASISAKQPRSKQSISQLNSKQNRHCLTVILDQSACYLCFVF